MSGASAAEALVHAANRSSQQHCGMLSVRPAQVMVASATRRIRGRRKEHRVVSARDTVPEPPVWIRAMERGGSCGTSNHQTIRSDVVQAEPDRFRHTEACA